MPGMGSDVLLGLYVNQIQQPQLLDLISSAAGGFCGIEPFSVQAQVSFKNDRLIFASWKQI